MSTQFTILLQDQVPDQELNKEVEIWVYKCKNSYGFTVLLIF